MKKKIFITGGTGFIGTNVIKKLREENEILLLVPAAERKTSKGIPKVKTIFGDLSNISKWKNKVIDFKPQATVHMAWEGLPRYDSETSIKNLHYGLDLINMLAETTCKRVLVTGSCWEYGKQKGKLKEDITLKPFNVFTAAKNSFHWLGEEIAKGNNMQFIWTRIFYVYGPGQRKDSLVPYIIRCIKEGKEPTIKTPLAKNDFIYVGDVAEAISMIIKKCNKSSVYNIGSGKSTSVQDIIKIVYNNLNPHHESKEPPKSNTSFDNFWADISKIKREIGWKPKTTIKEGIKRTLLKI